MRYRFLGLLLLCVAVDRADQATSQSTIVLTTVENGVAPQESFTCYGKIHGYIRLARRENGSHLLESRWILPSGKVAADSQTPLDFNPGRSTAYVWFSFPESSSLLGAPDPQLDQDHLSFHGLWHLEVLWDKAILLKKEFSVHCP